MSVAGDTDDFGPEDTVPDQGPERRAETRVEASFEVRYESLDEFVVAYSADISHGGLYLATDRYAPAGSVIRLDLALPDAGPTVKIIARVAYILDEEAARARGRSPGMGMRFLDVDGEPIGKQVAAYLTQQLGEEAAVDREPPANIVVVDDDNAYRERACAVLRAEGHTVRQATNGLEGLGAILRDPPELVLSDVQMPTMDGWQLLRLIRARPNVAGIPLVFMTTLGSEQDRLKGYRMGVDDYIAKPFQEAELAARIRKLLRRSRVRPRASAIDNALRGDLAQVGLASVLSFVEMERRSGTLLLVRGDQLATLHIRDGQVVCVELPADAGALEGIERLFYVLDWQQGRFDLTAAEVTVEDSIRVQTGFAILEHARKQDERGL